MLNPSMSPAEARQIYPDAMTLREAREIYFQRAGFDDATYTDRWVRLPVGPFTVRLPNVAPRREAVKVHDLDHIVTGYGTNWPGECEISAFEIGVGTGRYWFGGFIDTGGLAVGLLLFPSRTLRAFARGRRSKQSIYRHIDRFDDAVLEETVGSLRHQLRVPDDATVTMADKRAALAWAALGVFLHLGVPLLALAGVIGFILAVWT